MSHLSDEAVSGKANGFNTKRVSNGSWTNGAIKTIEGAGVGPKMVQLFGKQAETAVNLSAGLDSDLHWQYDDKRDKANFPITHAVRETANTLHFRSQGVSQIPEASLEYSGLGVLSDGSANTRTDRFNQANPATTNNMTSYVVSSNLNTAYTQIWEGWDNDSSVHYGTNGVANQTFTKVDFLEQKKVMNKARVYGGNQPPRGLKIQGSNDDINWVDLFTKATPVLLNTFENYSWDNSVPYRYYRLLCTSLTGNTNSVYLNWAIELFEAELASTVQVDSIQAGATNLLSSVLDLTGSSQAAGLTDIITAINNGPTSVVAGQHPDYPTRIRLTDPTGALGSSVVSVATQGVTLTKLSDFSSYEDGSCVVNGPEVISPAQAEDKLGIFPGAQIVDTLDNKYHITDISSDNKVITVAETLPPDAEFQVKRIANAEKYTTLSISKARPLTSNLHLAPATTVQVNSLSGLISCGSGVYAAAISFILNEIYSLSTDRVLFSFDTVGTSDLRLGYTSTDTTTPVVYTNTGVSIDQYSLYNVGSGSWEGRVVGGLFRLYKNNVLMKTFSARIDFKVIFHLYSNAYVYNFYFHNQYEDGGFRVTTNGGIVDQNHFHVLAPNGQESILYKPSAGAQITNFGFRLPDNSDWAVNMHGEEGYMAFATKFNLDLTPKNCVIYNKTTEEPEVIASSLTTDHGLTDGQWYYRASTGPSTWSPASNAARAFAAALESSADNRNPASYFQYQHPDILTQEQWSKYFFGTDKVAPFVGVRSLAGGAPEFTNIWAEFSAALRDIKLGTGSVSVEPIVGSKQILLTNVSGKTIDGVVDAYVLG